MIAYLGTGLLGTGFTKAFLKKGKQVQVWNRTGAKAIALEAFGARAFDTAAEAVKGASRVHITLSDDAAVDQVLAAAFEGIEKDAVIIDHTTTSPAGTAARVTNWKDKGVTYIHAPVFMGPQNALDGTGIMMISGDQQLIGKISPELEQMTGKLINLGVKSDRAAGIKLLGNMFLISITGGLTDTLALGNALDIPSSEIASLFEWFNPATMIGARFKKMVEGQFDPPSWELKMARKDVRLMMESANEGSKPLTVIPAIAQLMDKWIKSGNGEKDWSIISKEAAGEAGN